MSVLGQSYRIMYLAQGRRIGLRDVVAAVLRPDDSIVGIYPLREGVGMFKGCYYYDYLSSIDDREGEYFSLVVSPSEDRSDIVRFGLYKPALGGDDRVTRPVAITGQVKTTKLKGEVVDDSDVWAHVAFTDISGRLTAVQMIEGIVSDTGTDGRVTLNPQID